MKWRPRFSLRTLLLFVLALSASLTFYWNSGAWGIAFTIRERSAVYSAGFSGNGQYCYTLLKSARENGTEVENVVNVYNANTGKLHLTVCGGRGSGGVYFSPANRYVVLWDTGTEEKDNVDWRWENMWSLETGEAVNFGDLQPHQIFIGAISPNDTYVCFGRFKDNQSYTKRYTLSRLSDMTFILALNGKQRLEFSHNEEWLAYENSTTKSLGLYSLKSQAERNIELTSVYDYFNQALMFTQDDRKLVVSIATDVSPRPNSHEFIVFDVFSGRRISAHSGTLSFLSSDSEHAIRQDPRIQKSLIFSIDTPDHTIPLDQKSIAQISRDGETVFAAQPHAAYDIQTGKKIWQLKSDGYSFSPDDEYLFSNTVDKRVTIVSARTGLTLFLAPKYAREADMLRYKDRKVFSICGKFLTTAYEYSESEESYKFDQKTPPIRDDDRDDWKRVNVWHLRRPVEWWGFAWLPEFWLAIVFTIATGWSIWRDRNLAAK